MNAQRATKLVAAAAIVVAGAVLGARFADRGLAPGLRHANNTAVLGGYGPPPNAPLDPAFPAPPAPKGADPVIVDQGEGAAAAVWAQQGQVFGGRYTSGRGWSDVRALESIAGEASDLQAAGNPQGGAMAVWRHTVGDIQSLRYSRLDKQAGWTAPDVIPGILPKRLNSGARPRLMVDEQGNVTLQWPSGFGGTAAQVTRYESGRGWTQPIDVAAR